MFEVGILFVKVAGRDAGKKCIIVDVLDAPYVLVDGQTRRRKCNTRHLEPLDKVLKIKKNASHEDISKVLSENGILVEEKKPKEKKEKPAKEPKKEAKGKKEKPKKAAKKA